MTAGTIAQRVAERAGGDGLNFYTDRGVEVHEFVARCASRIVWSDTREDKRYIFPDGSEIVGGEHAWNLGIGGCFCWDGCESDYWETSGHHPDCELAEECEYVLHY